MIKLYGTPISNYYNKVKLALLEKGVPFDEMPTGVPGVGLTDETLKSASPLGKIPFITVDGRPLCESQVIVDFIEAAYPHPPLVPADPYAAAKVRELATFIDLHLELVARELYRSAFFGGPALSDQARDRVHRQLLKNIAAFKTLARFAPFVAGDSFTLADCSGFASLPVVSMATKAAYGEDLLGNAGIDVKAYSRLVTERPSAARVIADRKAAQAAPPTPKEG